MAAKSTGRWCSWIWTELRPQRVMWGRPSPARWEKMRWPQTVQSGLGVAVLISLRCVGPEVEGEEGAAHEVGLVGEEFEGFGGLDGGGEVDGGGEDAGGVAGFDGAGGGLGEDAGEAGGRGVGSRE